MTMQTRSIMRAAVAVVAMSAAAGACGGKDSSTAPADPTIVVSVTVAPLLDTLVSIGETMQLGAVAKNAAGAPVPSATIGWTSNNASVVSITGAGSATGVANGTATITASAGDVQGSATVVVKQRVATLEIVLGDDQGAQAATALDTAIVLVARDALGNVMPGVVVNFAATAGAVEPAQATTGAEGLVTTAWTMGTVAGPQELDATVEDNGSLALTLTAVTFPAAPDSIELAAGDEQSELASMPLPAPIQVVVRDRYGNPVPDLPVIFTPAGGGTLDSTDVLTNLEGVASTTWTLGGALGDYSVSATVADSAIPEGAVVRGGPVAFMATAVPFDVAVSSATVVAGEVATLTGTGLSMDPFEQTVTVDGIAATITQGTTTSLNFTVPSFGCVPGRPRTIEVTRGANVGTLVRDVEPEGLLSLDPGERVILPSGGGDCLQLPAATGGSDEYLVGLTATGRLNAQLLVELSALTTATAVDTTAPAKGGSFDIPQSAPRLREGSALLVAGSSASAMTGTSASPAARHIAQREWESSYFSRRRSVARRSAGLRLTTARASAVGDVLPLRVPNILADACNDYTAVNATVLAQGPRVVVASDATLPGGPLADVALPPLIDELVTLFGDEIYAAVVEHFGLPADLDADGQVTLLFSPAALPMGVPAFSSAVDATDRATCPSSDEGAVIYVGIEAAPDIPAVTTRLRQAAPHLAHELVHVIQSRRITLGGVPIAAWLAEGQAEMGTEIVGFLRTGFAERTDLDATDLNSSIAAGTWFGPRFNRLSSFFGWNAAGGKTAGAPEGCSLFGFGGLSVPCRDDYVAGAGWSFMRYVLDRVASGPAGAGNTLLKSLLELNLSGDGTALFESLTGSTLDELMIEWAMTLYADGRIAASLAPDLQFGSWNLASVFQSLPAEQRLAPATHGFAEFVDSWNVVGGGTAYTTIGAGGAHGPLAIRARDPAGDLLGSALVPRLWVVRVR